MDYNAANVHDRDCRIAFDAASHVYTVVCGDGRNVVCDSVTTVVDDLFDKFDADYWAQRKATPEHSAAQIKAEWDAKGKTARDLGTQLHERIERYYLGYDMDPEALSDRAFLNFIEFAREADLKPFRSEWRIFSERYRIAGTLDFLAFDGSGFDIYDWKRSAKIVDAAGTPVVADRFGKHAHWPVEHVPDTTYNHYALQVSLYRYILETEYGISVRTGHLGTFHPDYTVPYVVDVPYLRDEVRAILQTRL